MDKPLSKEQFLSIIDTENGIAYCICEFEPIVSYIHDFKFGSIILYDMANAYKGESKLFNSTVCIRI